MHYRFDSEDAAIRFSQAVDAALGYPKKGTNVGGGIHAPDELTVTRSFYGEPRKHPTRDAWAFPHADEVAELIMATPALAEGAVVEVPDETWRPAVDMPTPVEPPIELQREQAVEAVGRALGRLSKADRRKVLTAAAAKVEEAAAAPAETVPQEPGAVPQEPGAAALETPAAPAVDDRAVPIKSKKLKA